MALQAKVVHAEAGRIKYIPAVAVVAGQIVDLGGIVGVASSPIAASAEGSLATEGVFDVNKDDTSGPAFVIGDAVFWDYVNLLAVRTGGSGTVYLGTAVAAAGASDAYVCTQLEPASLPAYLTDKLWEDYTLASPPTLDIEDNGKVINCTVGHASNAVILTSIAALSANGAGMTWVVRCGASGIRIAVSPNAIDKFFGPNLTGTDNKDRILLAATSHIGDYMVVQGGHPDGWQITAQRGVWSNEA